MSVIDLLIRIKNGYMARRKSISSPYSKFREAILSKLKSLGYIKDYSVSGDIIKTFDVTLQYNDTEPAITDVKIFSKPGRRMYTNYQDITYVKGGMGHALISTSKGILTGQEARKMHIGGELLFHIW